MRPRRRRWPRMLVGSALAGAAAIWAATRIMAPPAGPEKQLGRPIFVRYQSVQGDTPSSIAATFSGDSRDIARQAGVQSLDVPLPAGSTVSIDASALWTHISRGTPASTESLVETTARSMGVEPAFAVAVGWQESKLDEAARSNTGAVGIMQLEPDTSRLAASDLGQPIDASNPRDNVVAGIFWLRSLLRSYGGDRRMALAAYYEGPGNLANRGYLLGTAEYVSHAEQIRNALLAVAPTLKS